MTKPLFSVCLGIALFLLGVVFYYTQVAEGWVMPLFKCAACFVLGGVVWASWDTLRDLFSDMLPGVEVKRDSYHKAEAAAMHTSKSVNPPSEELRTVSAELRKQVDRLSAQVDGLGRVASSAELEGKVGSLQKLLVASQAEQKLAKDSLATARKALESAETEKGGLSRQIEELTQERARLRGELNSAQQSREKLISAESNRLAQMVPAGLLDSSVGQTVIWCAEAAAKGDRVAAQIFASLQSIKAAQGDDELKGLLLSSLQVLGQSLTRLAERQDYSPEQKYEVLSSWSSVLNEIASSRFTLIVPSIGARLNLNTMVSSGAVGGNVNVVHCWGVMNENRDLYSPALVS